MTEISAAAEAGGVGLLVSVLLRVVPGASGGESLSGVEGGVEMGSFVVHRVLSELIPGSSG